MSEPEVQALYEQLRKLRGQLPEFLQTLTSLDDANSSQEAFFIVAKALSAWTAETKAFVSSYEQMKNQVESLKQDNTEPVKHDIMDVQDDGFNGLDASAGIDTFSNDFFDLT